MSEPMASLHVRIPRYLFDGLKKAAEKNQVEVADVVFGACAVALETLLPGEWVIKRNIAFEIKDKLEKKNGK